MSLGPARTQGVARPRRRGRARLGGCRTSWSSAPGPNGLAAAVVLARAGLAVERPRGRSPPSAAARAPLELAWLPGLVHDICSAVHPMAVASPFFRASTWPRRGVDAAPARARLRPAARRRPRRRWPGATWTAPPRVSARDGEAWRSLLGPLVAATRTASSTLAAAATSARPPPATCSRPRGSASAARSSRARPRGTGGSAARRTRPAHRRRAHAIAPLPSLRPPPARGLLLAAARARRRLADPGRRQPGDRRRARRRPRGPRRAVQHRQPGHGAADLPPARAVLLDTTPAQPVELLGDRAAGAATRARLRRFRYGNGGRQGRLRAVRPGAVGARRGCGRAGTRARRRHARRDGGQPRTTSPPGRHADVPTCCVPARRRARPGRARSGQRPLWTYAHVPPGRPRRHRGRHRPRSNGSPRASATSSSPAGACPPRRMSRAQRELRRRRHLRRVPSTLWQMLARPTPRWDPYRTGRGRACTCAPRRRRPGPACTGWPACTPRPRAAARDRAGARCPRRLPDGVVAAGARLHSQGSSANHCPGTPGIRARECQHGSTQ